MPEGLLGLAFVRLRSSPGSAETMRVISFNCTQYIVCDNRYLEVWLETHFNQNVATSECPAVFWIIKLVTRNAYLRTHIYRTRHRARAPHPSCISPLTWEDRSSKRECAFLNRLPHKHEAAQSGVVKNTPLIRHTLHT